MTRVVVFGTFDLLHKGHEHLFEQAKAFGNELFVVVARDVTVRKVKSHAPVHNEHERLANVAQNKHVAHALLGHAHDNRYQIIEDIQPDVICIGYDQRVPKEFERTLFEKGITAKVIKLKAYFPKKYKTTILRNKKHNIIHNARTNNNNNNNNNDDDDVGEDTTATPTGTKHSS